MIRIRQLAVGGYDKNFSYLIIDEDTRQALLVDPAGNFSLLHDAVKQENVVIAGIVLTHTHTDHFDQLETALAHYPVPVCVHEIGVGEVVAPSLKALQDGDEIPLGETVVTVMHTPGHSPDAICLYVEAVYVTSGHGQLIAGDTLFVEGCGRTNETGVDDLYDSLRRLTGLPADTEVYPGHDYGSQPTSTIAHELEHNQYLLAADKAAFRVLRLR